MLREARELVEVGIATIHEDLLAWRKGVFIRLTVDSLDFRKLKWRERVVGS